MTHGHNGMDPNTDPVFHDTANQPYARRSSSFIFFLGISAIAIIFFSGWFSSGGDEESTVSQQELAAASNDGSNENPVYSFFRSAFSGIESGLEDNSLNLPSLSPAAGASTASDKLYVSGQAGEVPTVPKIDKTAYFDGKILDYEGNIAGEISAIKQTDGEEKSFDFVLKQALTPADKARRYSIPEDEVKVVQNDDVFFIQLNKEQTNALAKMLYETE